MQFISAGKFGTADIESTDAALTRHELSYAGSIDLLKEILTFNPGLASESVSFA